MRGQSATSLPHRYQSSFLQAPVENKPFLAFMAGEERHSGCVTRFSAIDHRWYRPLAVLSAVKSQQFILHLVYKGVVPRLEKTKNNTASQESGKPLSFAGLVDGSRKSHQVYRICLTSELKVNVRFAHHHPLRPHIQMPSEATQSQKSSSSATDRCYEQHFRSRISCRDAAAGMVGMIHCFLFGASQVH